MALSFNWVAASLSGSLISRQTPLPLREAGRLPLLVAGAGA